MADYTDIKQRAQEIRDEVRVAANTANRVGVVLELITDAIEQENTRVDSALSIIENILTPYDPLYITRGRLGLQFGSGLYVENGVLHATGGGGGSGEGVESYIPGNGLELINNILSVKLATDTSGKNVSGLDFSKTALSLKLGSGLTIDTQSGDAMVNIGTGLQIGDDKKLFCNVTSKTYIPGNGVAISGDAISVNYGTGLAVSGGKLYSTVTSGKNYTDGNGISISGENKISVKHGDGLKFQDTFLTIATGDGLHLAAGGMLAINPSDGLGFTSDGMLKLKLHEKSGLKVDSEGLGVNVGVALGTVDGKLNVQYGTGLSVSDNKIYVDTSKIAGEGIDINTDNKKLEIGTQAAKALAGAGLIADGTKIKVDAENLTVAARCFYVPYFGTNVRDANVETVGLLRNYHSPTYWKNMPDGMGYGQMLNLRGSDPTLIGQLAWDVNHGSITDVTKGLWWRANDELNGFVNSKWHQIAFTDGTVARATADANGNDIASTYQAKLTMGSGLDNTNNKLSIRIGTGLSYDTTSGVPCVALAPQSYLKFYDEGNGMASLSVDLEAIRAALSNSGGANPIE